MKLKRQEIKEKIDKLFREYLSAAIPIWDKWCCAEILKCIENKKPISQELLSGFAEMCEDYKL